MANAFRHRKNKVCGCVCVCVCMCAHAVCVCVLCDVCVVCACERVCMWVWVTNVGVADGGEHIQTDQRNTKDWVGACICVRCVCVYK